MLAAHYSIEKNDNNIFTLRRPSSEVENYWNRAKVSFLALELALWTQSTGLSVFANSARCLMME